MYKILIVEDEYIAAEYLKLIVEKQGWEVIQSVDNGTDALESVRLYDPDLVLLDIMIKGSMSGCEVAMHLRTLSDCAIIFTTAYADDEMIGYAMDAKADGYIIKPYNEREIIAAISLLNAKRSPLHNTKISKIIGGFCFNHETHLLYKHGEIIKMSPNALKLIQMLCEHRHHCVSYEQLYTVLWDDERLNLKKLQMVIYRIREICGIDFFENINGVGYKIKMDYTASR